MTYREGSRGAIVKQIQKVVRCYPDGIWGKLTTEAVKNWQRDHGLTADGIAGPRTLAAMGLAALTPQPTQGYVDLTLKKSRRRIDYIVVHCTASPEGQAMTVDDIRKIHKKQGWADIGYHYVVTLDGKIHQGRDVDLIGAHVAGHNTYSIGVCYVGGLENRPGVAYDKLKGKDTRNEAQKNALMNLLMDLRRLYPDAKICGHRDFSPDKNGDGIISPCEWIKECPCFDAAVEYRYI